MHPGLLDHSLLKKRFQSQTNHHRRSKAERRPFDKLCDRQRRAGGAEQLQHDPLHFGKKQIIIPFVLSVRIIAGFTDLIYSFGTKRGFSDTK